MKYTVIEHSVVKALHAKKNLYLSTTLSYISTNNFVMFKLGMYTV